MSDVWRRVAGDYPATRSTHANRLKDVVIEEISDLGRLDELCEAWTRLLAGNSSDTIFLTWEWGRTWWKHLAKHCVLRVLMVRRGGRLIGIAPLVIVPPRLRRLLPFRTTEFAGKGPIGPDYLDFIVDCREGTAAVETLGERLASSRHVIILDQVAAGPRPAFHLAQTLEGKGWRIVSRPSGVCPCIHLEGQTWESYLASLGTSHRQNLRRRLRQIQKDFAVELIEAETEAQRRQCLRDFEYLHRRRWGLRGGSDALTGPGVMRFHDEFSRLALERGWLRLYVLRLDNQPAACIYGFLYHDVFYFYQSGFNPDFARYSVGLVAMALSIQRAISEGARCYDMLHGGEQYKYLWANGEHDLVAYDCYPPTVRGALAHRVVKARTAVKGFMHKASRPSGTKVTFGVTGAQGH